MQDKQFALVGEEVLVAILSSTYLDQLEQSRTVSYREDE
jgi:hypothetical protein